MVRLNINEQVAAKERISELGSLMHTRTQIMMLMCVFFAVSSLSKKSLLVYIISLLVCGLGLSLAVMKTMLLW